MRKEPPLVLVAREVLLYTATKNACLEESVVHVIAVSGANIRHQPVGTSVQLADNMLNILKGIRPDISGEVVALVNKEIAPCIGCGGCIGSASCVIKDDFSDIYAKLMSADGLVFVAPHYAPIPAKLCALLERVESIAFLNRWGDSTWSSPLGGKPVALIGHGGAAGDAMQRFYHDVVLIPLKNALGYPVEAEIVKVAAWPHIGVVTGPSTVKEGERFPIQEFDWDDITTKLTPLAAALVTALKR